MKMKNYLRLIFLIQCSLHFSLSYRSRLPSLDASHNLCYDNRLVAKKCQTPFENVAENVRMIASSTCGTGITISSFSNKQSIRQRRSLNDSTLFYYPLTNENEMIEKNDNLFNVTYDDMEMMESGILSDYEDDDEDIIGSYDDKILDDQFNVSLLNTPIVKTSNFWQEVMCLKNGQRTDYDKRDSFYSAMQYSQQATDLRCSICDNFEISSKFSSDNLNDKNVNETCWMSSLLPSPTAKTNISIHIPFGKKFEIIYVKMKFCSGAIPPESLSIWKSMDHGKSWIPFQYYSNDCVGMYGKGNNVQLTKRNEQEAICNRFPLGLKILPKSSTTNHLELTFSTMKDRPSAKNFETNVILQDWITATDIKIEFNRLLSDQSEITSSDINPPTNSAQWFYSMSDISVGGRCKCHGHASKCILNELGKLVCACDHNTEGDECERCKPFYQDRPWARATSLEANECKECNCYRHSTLCRFDKRLYLRSGGKTGSRCIDCQHNTDGDHCQKCQTLYYRDAALSLTDANICQACECHAIGSKSPICDTSNGQCPCKVGVTGRKCNMCKPGYKQTTSSDNPCKKTEEKNNVLKKNSWGRNSLQSTRRSRNWSPPKSCNKCYIEHKRVNLQKFCRKKYVFIGKVIGIDRSISIMYYQLRRQQMRYRLYRKGFLRQRRMLSGNDLSNSPYYNGFFPIQPPRIPAPPPFVRYIMQVTKSFKWNIPPKYVYLHVPDYVTKKCKCPKTSLRLQNEYLILGGNMGTFNSKQLPIETEGIVDEDYQSEFPNKIETDINSRYYYKQRQRYKRSPITTSLNRYKNSYKRRASRLVNMKNQTKKTHVLHDYLSRPDIESFVSNKNIQNNNIDMISEDVRETKANNLEIIEIDPVKWRDVLVDWNPIFREKLENMRRNTQASTNPFVKNNGKQFCSRMIYRIKQRNRMKRRNYYYYKQQQQKQRIRNRRVMKYPKKSSKSNYQIPVFPLRQSSSFQ
ncbi:hypothetical protein SNEBB_007236 [Seison nebaliae]|nr:hypothetical protein SNEBB_007236 [Seison nebaliae]